jgi:hypothetical protein
MLGDDEGVFSRAMDLGSVCLVGPVNTRNIVDECPSAVAEIKTTQ